MSRHTAFLFSFVLASALILSACQPNSTAPSPEPTLAPVMETDTTGDPSEVPGLEEAAPGDQEVSVETTYQSPAQLENVSFTLSVDEEGVITRAESTVLAEHPISIMRQESFAAEFPAALQGKKLAELTQVDRIGGSSLTTGAFNRALADLKAQL